MFTRRLPLWGLRGAAATLAALIGVEMTRAADSWTLDSPSGRFHVRIDERDGIRFSISLAGQQIVAPSQIDLKVEGVGWLGRQAGEIKAREQSRTESIAFVVPRKYRERTVAYRELMLEFSNAAKLVFRAYDDGIAYRWETRFPNDVTIEDEQAQFNFPGEPRCWFPEEESVFSHQERVYKDLPLAEIGSDRFCSTGVLISLANGRKVFISESDLRSYPGMFLRGADNKQVGLVGKFAGFPLETAAKDDRNVPVTKAATFLAKTGGTRTFPWRVMIISERDAELLQSELIHQLAPPLAIEDSSWIKPGKVCWDWWNGIDLTGVDFRAGVNTETYKYFIDFAAAHNIEYILLDEGWTASTTDILHENPDVDLPEISAIRQRKRASASSSGCCGARSTRTWMWRSIGSSSSGSPASRSTSFNVTTSG